MVTGTFHAIFWPQHRPLATAVTPPIQVTHKIWRCRALAMNLSFHPIPFVRRGLASFRQTRGSRMASLRCPLTGNFPFTGTPRRGELPVKCRVRTNGSEGACTNVYDYTAENQYKAVEPPVDLHTQPIGYPQNCPSLWVEIHLRVFLSSRGGRVPLQEYLFSPSRVMKGLGRVLLPQEGPRIPPEEFG